MKGSKNARTATAPKSARAAKAETNVAPVTSAKPTDGSVAADDRLTPHIGKTLTKLASDGSVRASCEIKPYGVIVYDGQVFHTLSGAAQAACKKLGLKSAVNGFVWWGITKPAAKVANPADAISKAWQRFADRIAAIMPNVTDENRKPASDALASAVAGLADIVKACKG